ncbi:MAG TPA: hypothetical protein VF549_05645 [Solirubrobacteraceae bacterium]|jgi:hypothetical protein
MTEQSKADIPEGATRLPDLRGEQDVDAALRLWHSGASRDLVAAVGGEEALELVDAEVEASAPD